VICGPELAGDSDLLKNIIASCSTAAIVYSNGFYAVAADAVGTDVRVASKIYNGIRPVSRREHGVALAVLQDKCVGEVINDGHHLSDPVIRMIQWLGGPQRTEAVGDAMAAPEFGDGGHGLGSAWIRVVNGKAMFLNGSSLAASLLRMDAALRRAVRTLGLLLLHGLIAPSTVRACVLRLETKRRRLAAGM